MSEAAAGIEAPADGHEVGIVVIGRNEGDRLTRCLHAVVGKGRAVVYCDSGSSDGSSANARNLGADVVDLDPARPFTAARGRNEGLARLQVIAPGVRHVQFIDGDCEIFHGWLGAATAWLNANAQAAIVCGRLRERHPDLSVYNRLCDAEWDRAAGPTLACGGIFMARVQAMLAAGGFREDLPAGEEPELCHRLRQAGWTIWRLAEPMAWHDAAMLQFGQWWKRSRRTGFGYAHTLASVRPLERHHVRGVASAWIWVVAIPAVLLLTAWLAGPLACLGLLVYPMQIARQAVRAAGPWRHRVERGAFLVLGLLPEWLGQIQYLTGRRRSTAGFDYKSQEPKS